MMPPLPKQNKKREADFGVYFRGWAKSNKLITGAYELKHTSTYAIPFNCLEDHQIAYLLSIKSDKGTLIRVQGLGGEPDYIYLRGSSAWVVIKFKDSFHVIDVEVFIQEKGKSKRRSLTSARAREISTYSVSLT